MMSDAQYKAACDAGDQEQDLYGAVAARYDETSGEIVVKLARGIALHVPSWLLQGLDEATVDDLRSIQLSPSGLGLHIERLDWDMSIPGIMQGRYGSPRWMMTLESRRPGVVRSGPARH